MKKKDKEHLRSAILGGVLQFGDLDVKHSLEY
jgi:hypothetical protein